MFRSFAMPVALALCALAPAAARSAGDADLAEIRRQIQELRSQYETRIQALERRLREAEQRAAAPAPAPATAALPSQPSHAHAASAGTASAFNPAISAILQGTYAHLSQDPGRFAIRGFVAGGEAGPPRRGFGLGESELVFAANVDPYFAGNLILSVAPDDSVAVEEAYGTYLGAPFGIATKFGRFLSGIGYQNEQHPHAWDFVDAPLAYQVFLGGRYAQDGVQLKWVAPMEQFLELGAEAGSGEGFPGGPRNTNGVGSAAVFAHAGGDVGVSHSWRAGLSFLRTRVDDRAFRDEDIFGPLDLVFAGRSHVAIADLVWKYAPGGNARRGGVKLQAELFRRTERGELTSIDSDFLFRNVDPYRARQSGGYVQGVYQFQPEWRAGVRHDWLNPGALQVMDATDASFSTSFRPKRSSVMVDYNPSEFSRVRLQYSRSRTLPGLTDNQWFVQYILSLGAHGAHKY